MPRVTFGQPSKREIEVLVLARDGFSDKEIAGRLGIQRDTVSNHMKSILSILGARNRTHAVIIAIRSGLIDLGEEE